MPATLQPAPAESAISNPGAQLSALLNGAGVAALDQTGWISVTGADRVRWLNGMVTNSIATLAPGEGNYNFVLNAQGRIQGDLTAWMPEDFILLETTRDQVEKLLATLDHYIIMDDVELHDWNSNRDGLLIAGPQAENLLRKVGFANSLDSMNSDGLLWRYFDWKPRPDPWPVEIIRAHSPLVPRYEIWSTTGIIEQLREAIITAGATPVSPASLEALRILEATPRYGTDIRNSETARDLPQETGQTRALHFSKGCYLGQEIVERIRSRGNVHRAFTGFKLLGALPPAGTALESEGKPVGELTSVAAIDLPQSSALPAALTPGPAQLALGYIRREALERGLPIGYPGGSAVPVALP